MSDKYVRFELNSDNSAAYGVIEGESVRRLKRPPWEGVRPDREILSLESVTLLAPVKPSKVVCVGLNYHAHVKASYSADTAPQQPLIFLKPPSALIGPGQNIVYPKIAKRVDYEAELALVIGKQAHAVSVEKAHRHIFGLTCANDVTARDLQRTDGQWSRAKGFDTFCPVGPWIVTDIDYSDLHIQGLLNGVAIQDGRTSSMIFSIAHIVSYISGVMTLEPGDIILTGTPAAITPMQPGDKVEVRIESVGTLENHVVAADIPSQ